VEDFVADPLQMGLVVQGDEVVLGVHPHVGALLEVVTLVHQAMDRLLLWIWVVVHLKDGNMVLQVTMILAMTHLQ